MSHLHQKVSALIDGELRGAARRRALSHARSCEACQRELEQTYALKERLLGLAAAEPAADLFALLGSVRQPEADVCGASRLGVVARRALVGAGSMSLAVFSVAYAVGGAETNDGVAPPINEFSAEFAGSAGLAPLSDPPVQALANTSAPSSGAVLVSAAVAAVGSRRLQPTQAGDDPRAMRWLHRTSTASSQVAYSATRAVSWSGPDGETTTVALDVQHAPGQGTSYAVTGDLDSTSATFIAGGEDPTGGGLGRERLDLLLDSYDVFFAGNGTVDGRRATVIGAGRDGETVATFWVDDASGLLLRRETYAGGRLVRSSSITSLQTDDEGFLAHLPPELDAPDATRLSTEYAPALNDSGWACPQVLPDDFALTILHRLNGQRDVMHAAYSDGLSTVSVYEERGTLDTAGLTGFLAVTSDGGSLWVREGLPTVAVWESGGTIYTVVTDAPASTAAELVAALPHEQQADTPGASRLGRGLARIGSYLDPSD